MKHQKKSVLLLLATNLIKSLTDGNNLKEYYIGNEYSITKNY